VIVCAIPSRNPIEYLTTAGVETPREKNLVSVTRQRACDNGKTVETALLETVKSNRPARIFVRPRRGEWRKQAHDYPVAAARTQHDCRSS
jgi:hypothetical protein